MSFLGFIKNVVYFIKNNTGKLLGIILSLIVVVIFLAVFNNYYQSYQLPYLQSKLLWPFIDEEKAKQNQLEYLVPREPYLENLRKLRSWCNYDEAKGRIVYPYQGVPGSPDNQDNNRYLINYRVLGSYKSYLREVSGGPKTKLICTLHL